MANSVDPDQTAGSALFAYNVLSETLVFQILGHLPYKKQTRTVLLNEPPQQNYAFIIK